MTTKEKILHVALELFNNKGYNEVGVREIARALHMSPGNLSYHFSKKEDIFFELMKKYSQNNDRLFDEFVASKVTLNSFLMFMRGMLKTQYQHRGLLLAYTFITSEIKNKDRLNYLDTSNKRRTGIEGIIKQLQEEKQINVTDEDVDFLTSFLTLFGRFSIQEAFFLKKERKEEEVLNYYLKMLSKQMSLFATSKGKKSMLEFNEI